MIISVGALPSCSYGWLLPAIALRDSEFSLWKFRRKTHARSLYLAHGFVKNLIHRTCPVAIGNVVLSYAFYSHTTYHMTRPHSLWSCCGLSRIQCDLRSVEVELTVEIRAMGCSTYRWLLLYCEWRQRKLHHTLWSARGWVHGRHHDHSFLCMSRYFVRCT